MLKYVVNEEKRTVVAIIDNVSDDFKKLLFKKFNHEYLISVMYDKMIYDKKYNYKNKIIGIAKCHPNDTWDVEKGKQIAKYKAMIAHKKYISYSLAFTIDYLTLYTEILTNLIYDNYFAQCDCSIKLDILFKEIYNNDNN